MATHAVALDPLPSDPERVRWLCTCGKHGAFWTRHTDVAEAAGRRHLADATRATDKPTTAQMTVLRYYAGMPTATTILRGGNWALSLQSCVRRGWCEPCDEFPYHRTTEAGLAAIATGGRQTPRR